MGTGLRREVTRPRAERREERLRAERRGIVDEGVKVGDRLRGGVGRGLGREWREGKRKKEGAPGRETKEGREGGKRRRKLMVVERDQEREAEEVDF